MKVIIDIPKEFKSEYYNDKFADTFLRVLADCKTLNYGGVSGNYEHETINMLGRAFCDSTPISDYATNGDMIMAMFPNAKVEHGIYGMDGIPLICLSLGTRWDVHEMIFVEDWWDSPYKGVEE